MTRNRIVFMGTWSVYTLALFVFPGFECRGLATGMIIGGWPALLSKKICESQHYCPIMFLLMMVVVSGATLYLFAWLMDKAGISRKILAFLFCAMILSGCYSAFSGINYERWQNTPAVAAAMAAPEVSYEPARRDFWNSIIIPKLLAGGLIGLYVVSGLGGLLALPVLLKKMLNPNKPSGADRLTAASDL